MTGVKINGRFLVLDALRVTFEIENSIFSEDVIFTGFSIPGEAPVCDENNRILSFGYKLNLVHKVKQYPCEFYFKGSSVFYGTFNLLETSRKSYRWNISISGLSAELLDKKLADLDYGDDFVLGDTTVEIYNKVKQMAGQFYPEIPICFPVTENTIFYGPYQDLNSANQDFKGYLNAWKSNTQEYWRNHIIQAPAQDNIQAFVPWVFTQYILKTIFASAGWSVTGTFVNDPEMSQHILYSGRALDRTVDVPYFKGKSIAPQNLINPIPNNWITLNIIEVEDTGNFFSANEYQIPQPIANTGVNEVGYFSFEFDFATHTAFPNQFSGEQKIIFGILYEDETQFQEIATAENYFLQQDFNYESRLILKGSIWVPSSKIGKKFVFGAKHYSEQFVLGNFVRLFVHSASVFPTSLNSFNVMAGAISLKDFVPNMSVRNFLENLRSSFALTMVPLLDSKSVKIDYFARNLSKIPNDLTPKALYEYNSTFQEDTEFFFDFDWAVEDELTKENFQKIDQAIYLGDFTTESDLPSFPPLNRYAYVTTTNRYYVSFKNPQNFEIIWKVYSDNFTPLVVGFGARKDIKPRFNPVFMAGGITDVIPSFRLNYIKPVLKAKGNSPCFGLGLENGQPLKMAFWRGLQPDKSGVLYPLATPYRYLDDGTDEFNVSLRWDEPQYGLFDRHWKRLANALVNTELLELDAMLNTSEIIGFDITRVQLVEDVYMAIKMMRITFGPDQPEPTEFEMYKL